MKKWWLPYLLPVVTLIIIGIISFSGEGFTGLVVFQEEPEIKISLHSSLVVPEDTLIEVYLDDQKAELTLKEFIEMTGRDYRYVYGRYDTLGFEGFGYTGPFDYSLRLSDLGLKGEGLMRIIISHKDEIIWQEEKNVR